VPVRGRDHPDVDADVLRRRPTRLNVFSSRNRSSFAWSAGAISPISSRNTVPPSADSSSPRFCVRASVKGAALVPEQLALENLLGQRRAGDVHERPRRPIARVVQHLRREILAGAALARQQHRRRRAARHFLQQRLRSRNRPAVPYDAIDAVRPRLARAQRAHFPAEPRGFERLFHEQRDFVEVERLVRVVVRACLHRLDRRIDGRIRRQQNDERVGVVSLIFLSTDRPSPSGSL
jgi:hypothetical protein